MSWHLVFAIGVGFGSLVRGCLAKFYVFWDKDDPRKRGWLD